MQSKYVRNLLFEAIRVATISFPPGSFGMQCDVPTGKVSMIREGFAAHKLGVQVGWQILSINDQKYHPKILTTLNREEGKVVKFRVPEQKVPPSNSWENFF